MDGEILARAGAEVVCEDISLGAAKRAPERARRHEVMVAPVVADVERPPFADRNLDPAYVHDGLHHLARPYVGLAEMLRVAGRAVSITEPADAYCMSRRGHTPEQVVRTLREADSPIGEGREVPEVVTGGNIPP